MVPLISTVQIKISQVQLKYITASLMFHIYLFFSFFWLGFGKRCGEFIKRAATQIYSVNFVLSFSFPFCSIFDD